MVIFIISGFSNEIEDVDVVCLFHFILILTTLWGDHYFYTG